jgi:hypothetical protein
MFVIKFDKLCINFPYSEFKKSQAEYRAKQDQGVLRNMEKESLDINV